MSTVIDSIERAQLRRVPSFQAGDRLRVHFLVIEGTRRRTQVFEGVAIKRQGSGARETFTVRKQSFGVGVERTFPVHSPKIEKIEVAARVRERGYVGPEEVVQPGLLNPRAVAAEPQDAEGLEDAGAVEATDGADATDGAEQVEVADEAQTEPAEPVAIVEGDAAEPAGEAQATDDVDASADVGGADSAD